MENKIQQLKQTLASIHWPTRPELIKDTTICEVTSAILATLISLWSGCIEIIVNFVIERV